MGEVLKLTEPPSDFEERWGKAIAPLQPLTPEMAVALDMLQAAGARPPRVGWAIETVGGRRMLSGGYWAFDPRPRGMVYAHRKDAERRMRMKLAELPRLEAATDDGWAQEEARCLKAMRIVAVLQLTVEVDDG